MVYIGRRIWGAQITHVFLHGKKESGWKGIRGCTIGYVYEAEKEGKIFRLAKRPERIKYSELPQEKIEEWEAQDFAAQSIVIERRADATLKRSTPLRKKLDELKPLIKKLNYFERRAFANYLVNLVDFLK